MIRRRANSLIATNLTWLRSSGSIPKWAGAPIDVTHEKFGKRRFHLAREIFTANSNLTTNFQALSAKGETEATTWNTCGALILKEIMSMSSLLRPLQRLRRPGAGARPGGARSQDAPKRDHTLSAGCRLACARCQTCAC
jgi:hypothetical protein